MVELALRALTMIFLVVAAGALLLRPSLSAVEIPLAGLDALPATRSPRSVIDPAAGEAIVDANIFSSSRAAPEVRYSPFESDSESDAPMITESAMEDSIAITEDEAAPRLYGTVVGPSGASALMRLDAATPGAQLYREGDRGGTFRVVKINEQSVVLSGRQGRIVLRLSPPEMGGGGRKP